MAAPGYLLDSDVIIWILRNRAETVRLVERLSQESPEPFACSALSVLEVWVGAKPGEQEKTATLFDGLVVIPVDGPIAMRAAALLAGRKRSGPREWVDAVIAASALAHARTILTYNRKDYPYPEVALYPT